RARLNEVHRQVWLIAGKRAAERRLRRGHVPVGGQPRVAGGQTGAIEVRDALERGGDVHVDDRDHVRRESFHSGQPVLIAAAIRVRGTHGSHVGGADARGYV